MADSPHQHRSLFGALFAAHLTPWQTALLDELMSFRSRDPAYVAAASRMRDLGRGARPVAVFYDEVARYYRTARRLSPMRRAYRSRMKARRRRG